MLGRLLQAQCLQRWARRLGFESWDKFLLWRHDLGTWDKMRRVFKRDGDPFGYGSSLYERGRWEAMEALLGKVPFGRALEVGCAQGDFTVRLAAGTKEIVAVDVSKRALRHAAERLPGAAVRWVHANIRRWEPEGLFDLIILGEVVYYLGAPKKGPAFAEAFDRFAARTFSWARPGGRLLVANGFGTDEELRRNIDYGRRFEKAGWRAVRETRYGEAVHDKGGMRSLIQLFQRPSANS